LSRLEIKNETVYVIYKNGKPYQSFGRKIVYTTKGSANGVITADAKKHAQMNYVKGSWWDLMPSEQEKLIEKEKGKFELVEYVPKKELINFVGELPIESEG